MMITTKYGKIEGIKEDGCDVFKGIPYAKPPIGTLRFHKPQKPDKWEGIFKADHFQFKSMQPDDRRSKFYDKEFYSNPEFFTEMSEDCLYLNIWVPEHRGVEKLPVAVYVHGGAFMSGAGSNLPFIGSALAKSGVIIVTINYRLGVFGFLCHPLLAESDYGAGNYGIWDQVAAIQWVRENISQFGGDAENITAFGQSAGAMSLQLLAVSQVTEGLFQRMILQSGGGYENPLAEYRTIEKAADTAEDLFEALGFHNQEWRESEEKKQLVLKRLYQSTSEEIMNAVKDVMRKAFEKQSGLPFVPVTDGELISKDGNLLMKEGKYHDISYLLGANANDITTENNKIISPETNRMHTANTDFANMVNANKNSNAYVYYFKCDLPGDNSGAFHSAELWYVFGTLNYCWRPMEAADWQLSEKMMKYWSHFMKTGNPNNSEYKNWKPCTIENPYYEILDTGEQEKQNVKLQRGGN